MACLLACLNCCCQPQWLLRTWSRGTCVKR
jgi:hypothetical protein